MSLQYLFDKSDNCSAAAEECQTKCIHGTCEEGRCVCQAEYTGEDCGISYQDAIGPPFAAYVVYSCLLSSIVLVTSTILVILTVKWKPRLELTQKYIPVLLMFSSFGEHHCHILKTEFSSQDFVQYLYWHWMALRVSMADFSISFLYYVCSICNDTPSDSLVRTFS